MIEFRQVTFSYRKGPLIFEDFSFETGKGEACSVIGSSGCGKTTLLYLLAGLLKPDSGKILVEGVPLSRPRPLTGLILQDHGLLPWYTVKDNVGLGLRIRRLYGPDGRHVPEDAVMDGRVMEDRVAYWMERLGIGDLRSKYPGQLSGGQRQRTAICRTLALSPDLLLMDEPFSSLDPPTREDLEDLVMDLQKETGITILVVTHNIEEAVTMGNRILVLENGTNRSPHWIDNACFRSGSPRGSREFVELCAEVRSRMGRVS
jgi:NitT/TauT family transport system ATP-binding protein